MPRKTRTKPLTSGSAPVGMHRRDAVFAIVLSLCLIIMLPFIVRAVATPDPADGPGGTTLDTLKADIARLQSSVSALSATVGDLKDRVGSSDGGATGISDGTEACVADCRAKDVTCLQKPTASAAAGTNPNACGASLNSCLLACKPSTPAPVACNARCAVGFGACLRAAGTDTNASISCLIDDRVCIATNCVKTSGTMGNTILNLPSGLCQDQCRLDERICNATSMYDSTAQAACQAVYAQCNDIVCATAANTPNGQLYSVICEDRCTATFNSCTTSAKGNGDLLASCNVTYGTCRDACRATVGGTGAFTAPTIPTPKAATSTPPASSAPRVSPVSPAAGGGGAVGGAASGR